MAASPENVANELIGRLEQAWNEADGRAFGEPFSADADLVDMIASPLRATKAPTSVTSMSGSSPGAVVKRTFGAM